MSLTAQKGGRSLALARSSKTDLRPPLARKVLLDRGRNREGGRERTVTAGVKVACGKNGLARHNPARWSVRTATQCAPAEVGQLELSCQKSFCLSENNGGVFGPSP